MMPVLQFMKPMRFTERLGVLLTLFASATVVHAASIHVSPLGDDRHPGTLELPVATPQRASELLRAARASKVQATEVILHQGVYELKVPLLLLPEDSGTAQAPVTWKAAPGERVVWSGGRRLPSAWKPVDGGIWQLELEGVGLKPEEWNFRQLFVDGQRATRARFPNASEKNPFLYATGGGMDHVLLAPGLVKACWGKARDAQINIVPHWKFFNQWNTVTGADAARGRIDFADSERHGRIIPGNWFWIEGVREELDAPGEWFLDTEHKRLEYMPPAGVDPNRQEIIAPVLDRLITLRGDVEKGTHVEHVRFEGIAFRHTGFTLGHMEARVHTDAALMFENTLDCSVRDCRFEHIGGYAVWLHLDSRRNAFDRNTVRDAGGGGVLMTGARLSYMDDSKIFTPGGAAAKVAPILNRVTCNTVEHCGRIRYYGGGVHLDSRPFSMSMEPGNYIAHNHFNDLSRNGVFAFRNQGGNVVEYNHIHNAMQTTVDGACIHFATMNHLNAPNLIANNWLHDIWGYEQKPDGRPIRHLANGVFLDWDTSNTTVKNNWVYNAGGEAIKKVWHNRNLEIVDNRVSGERITPPFVARIGPSGADGIPVDLESMRLIGGVLHYSDQAQVVRTGAWQQESVTGMWGLFSFNFLVGVAASPAEITYRLPIMQDGRYSIHLLYLPGEDRASKVPITIHHAEGASRLDWNMREGSKHGFAVPIGDYRFKADGKSSLVISTLGADGKVIADGVAFVKMAEKR